MSTAARSNLRPTGKPPHTAMLALLAFLALAMTACFGARLQTRAPRATAPTQADPRSVVLPDSIAHLPLTLPLAPFTAAVEASLPATFGLDPDFVASFRGDTRPARTAPADDGWAPIGPLDTRLVARMTATRGQTHTHITDGHLHFDTTVTWSALPALANDRTPGRPLKACGCNGAAWCGGDRSPPLQATVRHTLDLQSDAAGLVTPTITATLLSSDPCPVAIAPRAPPIDIATLALAPLVRASETTRTRLIESAAAHATDLAATLDTLKALLSNAIPVGSAFVGLRPLHARLGHFISIENDSARLDAIFQLQPVWGSSPAQVLGQPSTGTAGATAPSAFAIAVPVTVPVSALRERTAPFLIGRSFSLRDHRRADIENVRIWGSGGRAVVEVVITGSLPGAVHLVGDMRLDPTTGVMQLEHLDYTESSRAAMDQLFDDWQQRDLTLKRILWFDADGLRKAVHDAARWPLRDAIDGMRDQLVTALATQTIDDLRLSLTMTGMTVANRSMDREALRLVITMDGELGATPVQ